MTGLTQMPGSWQRLKRVGVVAGVVVGIVLLALWRMSALPFYTLSRALQDLANALTLGSLYALIALGYTMVYGIIRLINFAHGEIFMVGAFFAFYTMTLTPAPWLTGLVAAMLIGAIFYALARPKAFTPARAKGYRLCLGALVFAVFILSLRGFGWLEATVLSMLLTAATGVLMYLIAYRPLWGAPRTSFLITAIAVSFFMQNTGQLLFGPQVRGFRVESMLTQSFTYQLGEETIFFTGVLIVVPVLTALLLVGLHAFVTRTKMGKAMRACAQDAEVAQMMGVDVDRIVALTFFLGAMLAAVAGVFYAIRFGQIHPLMGLLPGIKAFAAAVIGGIGSLPGAVLGGVLLGFIEIFVVSLFPTLTAYRDVFAFVLLIVILVLRPAGLVGEDLTEKV